MDQFVGTPTKPPAAQWLTHWGCQCEKLSDRAHVLGNGDCGRLRRSEVDQRGKASSCCQAGSNKAGLPTKDSEYLPLRSDSRPQLESWRVSGFLGPERVPADPIRRTVCARCSPGLAFCLIVGVRRQIALFLRSRMRFAGLTIRPERNVCMLPKTDSADMDENRPY
jgi:hypothetical protein